MFHHRFFRTFAALLLGALLVSGCVAAPVPQEAAGSAQTAASAAAPVPVSVPGDAATEAAPAAAPTVAADGTVIVSTVDELLAAIGPDRTILMEAGEYTLTDASDYGQEAHASPYYAWEVASDGYGLLILDVENLTIAGKDAESVEINTLPRYAHVLSFVNCASISVSGFTAGHTDGPGFCSGGVLHFEDTDDVRIEGCDLYGCGTIGIQVWDCERVEAIGCTIRDCSMGAVTAYSSRNVQLRDCRMKRCGGDGSLAEAVLHFAQSESVAVINCTVEDNASLYLLQSEYCRDVQLLGSIFTGNRCVEAAFLAERFSPVVEGCAFRENELSAWYPTETHTGMGVPVVSKAGTALTGDDLKNMLRADVDYVAAEASAAQQPAETWEGMREVRVSTVDELLAGIASNTTLYLPAGALRLADASDYGAIGSEYYTWQNEYDGPALIISGVTNFHIVGEGADKTSIEAIPRYANVLTFRDCENISVTGVTLGHIQAPGYCVGGVLSLFQTEGVYISDCGLYGCGTIGLIADDSGAITVERTEIYDCSECAVSLGYCTDVTFTDCSMHDCGEPMFRVSDCKNVVRDGETIRRSSGE